MSLGLDDLKKKTSKKSKGSQPKKEEFPAGAWASNSVKSKTSRPWTGEALRKSAESRGSGPKKAPPNPEAVMNEEWSTAHADPLFWDDVNESPLLTRVQNGLSALEERIETSIVAPLRSLRKFVGR